MGAVRSISGTGVPVLVALSMAAAGCSSGRSVSTGSTATAIDVAVGNCGTGWTDPHGGNQQLVLTNSGDLPVQADLIDPRTGAVFGEAEGIGPGTSRSIRLNVARGDYAIRCIPTDGNMVVGPTVRISSGPRAGSPGVVPMSPAELLAAVKRYSAYVRAGLGTLQVRVQRLQSAGDRTGAERAWVPAHAAYESLGAAYGAFGDYAEAIDGVRTDGRTPDSGFHRVEYLLWHGAPMPKVRSAVRKLAGSVAGLRRDFPSQRVDPNDLGLRAHEILEATLQFELTGASDEGSGTNLATADANITGTQAVLTALGPALKSRYPGLGRARAALARLRTLIRAQNRAGSWTPVERLSRGDRERLDAALGSALELLAPVATIAAVRKSE